MKEEDRQKVREIRTILDGMHKRWREDPDCDGHCKSSEGFMSVSYSYQNWFEAKDYINGEPEVTVSIYSYLFGPSRMHDFYSFDEALSAVREWSGNFPSRSDN